MRWRRGSGGGDVEDLRGRGGIPGGRVGGGLGGLGLVGIVVALLVTFLGGGGGAFSPDASLDGFPTAPAAPQGSMAAGAPDPDEELVGFVTFVVGDVQDSWERSFARAGRPYDRTRLRLFTGGVRTGCGAASSATGPFYCPADRGVYLDLAFFRELRDRFGAPGDFAQAYVIAHEFGHHVQNVLGIMPQVSREQARDPGRANELSVRLELQADCLAGIWGRSAYDAGRLEEGDLQEGLAAASAVGDDRIQAQAGGGVDPDAFTHGTSEQRARWFLRGFEGGELAACDTFSGAV
ncbi:KPN_02809 family neutral zinc metallopeptidase [Miltoncostaea marina]|uniref:KPN_02809 family neutral zinc metallopeptidase n=1 Tax=Miltoncostaea marina TaxID=2843215 RepID=UPI001C3C5EB4|nr:neutral zinc metallopeptidase [Miltoncostaea marina]